MTPTLPVMVMADPLAWSLAEGIEFWGVVNVDAYAIAQRPLSLGADAGRTPGVVSDTPRPGDHRS